PIAFYVSPFAHHLSISMIHLPPQHSASFPPLSFVDHFLPVVVRKPLCGLLAPDRTRPSRAPALSDVVGVDAPHRTRRSLSSFSPHLPPLQSFDLTWHLKWACDSDYSISSLQYRIGGIPVVDVSDSRKLVRTACITSTASPPMSIIRIGSSANGELMCPEHQRSQYPEETHHFDATRIPSASLDAAVAHACVVRSGVQYTGNGVHTLLCYSRSIP
ncbi:hypothetical protein BD310DRAFT_926763, partial [Dichomitus squalens]